MTQQRLAMYKLSYTDVSLADVYTVNSVHCVMHKGDAN